MYYKLIFSIRKVFDPYLADACVDVNMQCPVWASTGPRNYGNALGPMYDGLGLGVLGYNPLPGIRKYDKGL
uniref:COesterase domain-containing protein n=1 Tax=Heterorhabditis bacteriophora TaxID=37862 RepID=A0A1I7XVL0_HETBA